MKQIKLFYWIATGLMALSLILLSLMAILMPQEVTKMFTHLGYTDKLLPLIISARLLAVITVLQPKFPKLKEWAYAGLVFELIGAIYSHIRAGDNAAEWSAAFFVLVFVGLSYYFYTKINTYEES